MCCWTTDSMIVEQIGSSQSERKRVSPVRVLISHGDHNGCLIIVVL
jgi:hypothetical protein